MWNTTMVTKNGIMQMSVIWHRCKRKKKYREKEFAEMIATKRSAESGHTITAYPCPYCHHYHIGREEIAYVGDSDTISSVCDGIGSIVPEHSILMEREA